MRIAVIGAGVSGLTFAAAMKRRAPAVQVELHERDETASSRPQGYAIGLRNEAGMQVLTELGLRDQVLARDAVRVGRFVICNQAGDVLLALGSRKDDDRYATYRVQRAHLKQVLLAAVSDTPVRYGRHCTGFEPGANGLVAAVFSDGQRVAADYLIACDGVGSAIRQQLIGDQKRYLGLASIYGEAPVQLDHPLLAGGYFWTLGETGASLFCYCQPRSVYFSYALHASSEAELADQPKSALLGRVLRDTQDWHVPVPTVVGSATVESIGVRGCYDKDPTARVRNGQVWLLGDAAHPMCPFQGQGANMAMLDALKMAELFAGDAADPRAVAALEADILKRGRKAVLESRAAAKRSHLTNPLLRVNRDLSFRLANLFIQLFSRSR